jgi:hypothetical protein
MDTEGFVMKAKKSGGVTIQAVTVTRHGFTYRTFMLRGWLNGERVRLQFKTRADPLAQKNLL